MELQPIITWYLLLLLTGVVGWPLASSLLHQLPDRGITLARPVGLLFTGYLLWLGGTFRLFQNSTGGIILALVIVLVGGLLWRGSADKWGWLKRQWRYLLISELLFVVAFGGWVVFKSYNPNIETAGGEKWMEIAFINGTLNSPYFPPQDPWLSGFGISYYYFGYVQMALLIRLSGIVPTTAFNLLIPTLFAMTLTAAFGLLVNLVTVHRTASTNATSPEPAEGDAASTNSAASTFSEPAERGDLYANLLTVPTVLTGLCGALFVGFLGNLIGVFEVLHQRGLLSDGFWTWLDIRNLKEPPVPSESWIPDRFMWWWRGSRVLTDYNLEGREQEVIDEFPFFSFLLGDVHPHVMALPFVLLVVGLALNLLISRFGESTIQRFSGATAEQDDDQVAESPYRLIIDSFGRMRLLLYAVAIGGLSFLNTWDFPIYLLVFGLTVLVWLTQLYRPWTAAIRPTIISTVLMAILSIALYLPFYATFQSQAGGILPNLWNPTHLPQFLVFFGPFIIASGSYILLLLIREREWRQHAGWTLPLTLLGPPLVMVLVVGLVTSTSSGQQFINGILSNPAIQQMIGGDSLSDLLQTSLSRRLAAPWTFLLLGTMLGLVAALSVGFSNSRPDRFSKPIRSMLIEQFVLVLLIVGLLLPLSVEFVYLRDNFGIRMNTIFKFYFQAWVLLALASAFAMYAVPRGLSAPIGLAWRGGMGLLIIGGLFYPILAIGDKTGYFDREPTLDGIAWIAQHYPADHAAIEWLRANTPLNAIILEAPGASYAAYQYTARISAMTGRPTLLGWGGHQSQWRGNYDEPGRREPDIESLYTTTDPVLFNQLMDKYNIRYVYVGRLERERYPAVGLRKFELLLTPVFTEGDVVIYER